MHPLINIAISAARNASKIILRAVDRLDTITITEKNTNDFVTDADTQAEQEIIKTIHKAYPQHAILAEEGGATGKNDYTWIIDPIDGTNNFIHGLPHFSISIAVSYKNKVEHGLVYNPILQELFTASRGSGAFLNDRRIRVSNRKNFKGALIGTGYGLKNPKNIAPHIALLQKLLPETAGIRRSGSAALDFAYVACGRYDGFWELGLAPWDVAAGGLLVKEAGGVVSDFSGNEDYLSTGNVIAANPKIHKLIFTAVNEL